MYCAYAAACAVVALSYPNAWNAGEGEDNVLFTARFSGSEDVIYDRNLYTKRKERYHFPAKLKMYNCNEPSFVLYKYLYCLCCSTALVSQRRNTEGVEKATSHRPREAVER